MEKIVVVNVGSFHLFKACNTNSYIEMQMQMKSVVPSLLTRALMQWDVLQRFPRPI